MRLSSLLRGRHGRGYRVQHHDPLKSGLQLLAALVLLAAAGWALYRLGFTMSGYERDLAVQERARLLEQIAFLEQRNEELTRQVAGLERSQAISQQANAQITAALNEMEARLLELTEELSFYRSIVSPSSMEPGLHVQSFRLEPGEGDGEYIYKLVLTLVRGNNRVARGDIDLSVEGLQDGVPATLSLKQISAQGSDRLRFSFKYFQSVEGVIALPRDFEPRRVAIHVKPNTRRLQSVQQSYDWAAVLVGERA